MITFFQVLITFTVEILEAFDNGFVRERTIKPFDEGYDAKKVLIGGFFLGYRDHLNLHFKYENHQIVTNEITVKMRTFYTYLTYTF